MEYIEFTCQTTPEYRAPLISLFSQIGFEGFQETDKGFLAYITSEAFSISKIKELREQYSSRLPFQYSHRSFSPKNWNEEWEKNFRPVKIDNLCGIRAPFHDPLRDVEHEIIINPQQSFGTGHHISTVLMIRNMLEPVNGSSINFQDQTVLDAGAGTGILSILAEKLGARPVYAVDNNQWAYGNSLANLEHNQCQHITVEQIDIFSDNFLNKLGVSVTFKVVLANLTKNMVRDFLPIIVPSIEKQGYLIVSGFQEGAVSGIRERADQLSLATHRVQTEKGWSSVIFQKKEHA